MSEHIEQPPGQQRAHREGDGQRRIGIVRDAGIRLARSTQPIDGIEHPRQTEADHPENHRLRQRAREAQPPAPPAPVTHPHLPHLPLTHVSGKTLEASINQTPMRSNSPCSLHSGRI